MMKILGIVCSPRKGGNTHALVDQALTRARDLGAETELCFIADKKIAPCDGCESCVILGKCKIEDDMQALYPKLIEANGIIVGTPVYYWGMTAQAKAFIDRTFIFRTDRPLRNKPVGLVVVARRRGISATLSALLNYCFTQKVHVVGGVTAYADEPGAVRHNRPAMEEATLLGRDLVNAVKGAGK
jgi:multimeric flavodoxin WrbA